MEVEVLATAAIDIKQLNYMVGILINWLWH